MKLGCFVIRPCPTRAVVGCIAMVVVLVIVGIPAVFLTILSLGMVDASDCAIRLFDHITHWMNRTGPYRRRA